MKEFFGIEFDEMPNSICTKNRELTILQTDGEEQTFVFGTVHVAPFKSVLAHYNPASVLVTPMHDPGTEKLNLDNFGSTQKIKTFHIDSKSYPVQVSSTVGTTYFPNLEWLSFDGRWPSGFPELRDHQKLTKLTVQYEKQSLEKWSSLRQLKDLVIYDYAEEDLGALEELKGLVRLELVAGKMKSLRGLEQLTNLETLIVSAAPKLVRLHALVEAKNLQNIKFVSYAKHTDWSFLAAKKNLRRLWLGVAETSEFIQSLPALEFFFCKKVKDRKNSGVHFDAHDDHEDMTPTGEEVSYVRDHDVFRERIA